MAFNRAKFLIEVLGPDGALALAKAAARSDDLAQMVVPRAILAWLEARPEFDDVVPGGDFRVRFTKSEDGFSGNIGDYQFHEATIFHVAGAVATAMSLDALTFGNTRNAELSRLGKSIDLMAKVNLFKSETDKKGKCPKCGARSGGHFRNCEDVGKEEPESLEKQAAGMGTGKTAGPVAPAAPAAPTASAPQHTTPQKQMKAPASAKPALGGNTMKLTRSESNARCPLCSQQQFASGLFVGCLCFRALAKSVTVVGHDDDHVEIRLGDGWDRATTLTLLESFGRK